MKSGILSVLAVGLGLAIAGSTATAAPITGKANFGINSNINVNVGAIQGQNTGQASLLLLQRHVATSVDQRKGVNVFNMTFNINKSINSGAIGTNVIAGNAAAQVKYTT